MDREQGPAPAALPAAPLRADEAIEAELPDPAQVLDHAHPVPGPVAPIHAPQSRTRELGAVHAEPSAAPAQLVAVPDPAGRAVLRQDSCAPAAGAPSGGAEREAAHAAVQAARCDQRGVELGGSSGCGLTPGRHRFRALLARVPARRWRRASAAAHRPATPPRRHMKASSKLGQGPPLAACASQAPARPEASAGRSRPAPRASGPHERPAWPGTALRATRPRRAAIPRRLAS